MKVASKAKKIVEIDYFCVFLDFLGQKNDIEEKIRIMCKYDVRALDEALLGSLGTVNSRIDKKQQKIQRSVYKSIFENPND